MMKRWPFLRAFLRVWLPGGSLLLLGDCALSDQQLQSIASSTITTGLNTLITQALLAIFELATQGAATTA